MTHKISQLSQKLENFRYGGDDCNCTVEHLPDLIRKRAYELFEARDRQPGRELEDWFQAEREINNYLGV
jgi:hypothetical protein